jgi:hypothetical protein
MWYFLTVSSNSRELCSLGPISNQPLGDAGVVDEVDGVRRAAPLTCSRSEACVPQAVGGRGRI